MHSIPANNKQTATENYVRNSNKQTNAHLNTAQGQASLHTLTYIQLNENIRLRFLLFWLFLRNTQIDKLEFEDKTKKRAVQCPLAGKTGLSKNLCKQRICVSQFQNTIL